jgi:hypothetical protein
MGRPDDDLALTVDYSTDSWFMNRVPWAMWACVAGAALALHAESRGLNGALMAVVYLLLLALVFAGFALTTLLSRSTLSSLTDFVVGTAIYLFVVVVVAATVAALGGALGHAPYSRSLMWSALIDPPTNVSGWMLLYLGLIWIAYAVFRHARPGRPVVRLTTDGIGYHRLWLRNVFIPWREVHAIGSLDISDTHGFAASNPNVAVVAVTQEFFARDIAQKRSFFEPPGSEFMFRSKDGLVQMALNCSEVAVKPEDYWIPMEARWLAFRNAPPVPPAEAPVGSGPNIVHGRWSINGTFRQAIQFLAPAICMAIVLVHATVAS